MTDRRPAKALIYCRVSTTKQEDEGNGLESQEMRCRQYAQSMGYEVEAVFPDSVSGGGDFMKRPGMVALLSYLDAQPGTNGYVVIFDDLKRFARDTEFHIRLRQAFRLRGARVECLNFRFEEKRVRDLEIQKALANEKIANCGRPLASFGETYRTAMEFLANPWKLWRSDRLEDRRAVLKLVFAERLPYARKNGYRTGEISMPFKLLGDMRMHKSEMVPLAGIEPARP